MRRNTKNDKVLRAISIGLATMIAVTSTPVTAFAGEGDEGGEGGSSGEPVAESLNETPAGGSAPAQSEGGEGGSAPSTILVENLTNTQSSTGSSIPVENLIPLESSLKDPVTVESASNDAATMVATAEGQTAEIGKMTTLVTAEKDFAQKAKIIENYIDQLAGKGTAGKPEDYSNQINDAETMAKNVEDKFGITVEIKKDEKGNPLRDADGKIQYVIISQVDADGNSLSITDKAEAVDSQIKAVKGENGEIAEATAALNAVENAITGEDKANAKVSAAETAMKNAQTKADGETARDKAKSKLDEDTTKKLNGIKDALEAAVNEEDINKAVAAATGASETAVNVAGTQHGVAEKELQNAKDAAEEAQKNVSNYSRQQMVNIATSAQKAADNAKEAERLATEAFNTAKQNEDDAKTALTNAQDGCSKAIKDAADVLTWYKGEIKKINDSITDANGPRATAKQAINDANDAIDAALALMDNESDKTVTGAKTAFLAYNTALTAIENVNNALSTTTDSVSNLMYPQKLADKSKKTDEDKKILESYDFYNAEKKRKNTNLRLSCPVNEVGGTKRNLLNELETAFTTYKEAVAATGIAEENRKSAADTVAEINRIIDGIEGAYQGFYDMLGAEAEQDRKDLQALLSTGYTYKELQETESRTAKEVVSQGVGLISLDGNNEYNNLTQEEIKEKSVEIKGKADEIVNKYNKAVSDNERLDALLDGTPASEGVEATKGLYDQIKDQQKIVDDCNSREQGDGTTPGLMDQAKQAQATVIKDEEDMRQKYAYDEYKQAFKKDAEGNYIISDAYAQLVTDSKDKTPDKYEYVNGNKTLTADKADYKSGDLLYKKTGTPSVVDGRPDASLVPEDDILKDGRGWYQKEINEKGQLVETEYYTYCTDITDTSKTNEGDHWNKTVYTWNEKDSNSDPSTFDIDEVTKELLRGLLGQNKFLTANLTINDIRIVGNTVYVDNVDPSMTQRTDIPTGGHEEHQYTFSMTIHNIYKARWGWDADYSFSIKETQANLMGKFTKTTTSNTEEYKLENTGGKETEKAKKAREKLYGKDGKSGISKQADDAKDKYESDKKNQRDINEEYDELKSERDTAAKALYGEDGINGKDNPAANSLVGQKNAAEKEKSDNQEIISKFGTNVSQYTTAKTANNGAKDNLNRADNFDPDNVDNYADKYKDGFEDYKEKFNNAAAAKGKIDGEKVKAQGYQTTANNALEELNKVRKDNEDPQKIYNNIKTKINKAQDRLDAVARKLSVLKTLQKDAQSMLTALTPINNEDLVTLYNKVDGELKGLKKLDPKTYDPVELLKTDGIPTRVVTSDIPVKIDASFAKFLNNKLAAAIETATGILETAQGNLSAAIENRQSAEMKLKGGVTILGEDGKEQFREIEDFAEDNIIYYAAKAQEEADKAAKALADWRAPEDDDDDDSSSSSSSTPGAGSYTLPGAGTYAGFDLSGLTFDDLDTGVAGARTSRRGAGSASGVLGVRTGEGDTKLKVEQPVIGNADDSTKDVKAGSDNQNLTKVDSELVPLADAPFEEGANMNLLWLLAAATAAGAGAYGYGKHRKSVAANEEAKKYKK